MNGFSVSGSTFEFPRSLRFLPPFFMLVLFACSGASERSEQDDAPDTGRDSSASAADTGNGTSTDTVRTGERASKEGRITTVMMDLAERMDSSGFTCDRERFEKTYGLSYEERIEQKGHHFYLLSFEAATGLMHKEDELLDQELMKQVERIIAHFYVDAELFSEDRQRSFFPDGIVEEWRFPDSLMAEKAARQMVEDEELLYFNRGAYVGLLNERVYLFHSRAAGFYTPLKDLWKAFTRMDAARVPIPEEQRSMFR